MNSRKKSFSESTPGDFPLASVVMPSFNQASFIREAVDSVMTQSYRAVELVVADGGSNDGTVSILQALSREYPDRLRWSSEPDRGPAHAINKALKLARGTIIGWLNSDDVYTPNAIQRAVGALRGDIDWLMVYGEAEYINVNSLSINRYPTLQPPVTLETFQRGCFICQPSVFFRRSLYVLLGDLDDSLETAFDFEYWLRVFRYAPDRVGYIPELQAKSRIHAATITSKFRRNVAIEAMKVLHRHVGPAQGHWILTYLREFIEKAEHPSAQALKFELKGILREIDNWITPEEYQRLQAEVESCLLPLCRSGNPRSRDVD